MAGNRAAYFLTLTAVVVWLILPLWRVSILPWTDFGDHMGRVFVLAHYGDVPAFYRAYEIKRLLLPNLAIDLIGPPLLRLFSPDVAAKVFASLSVLVFAAGCHVFGCAVHRRPSWLAVAAVFYFYNSFLIYGFVNFIWGVALFLISAALWVWFTRRPSWLMGAAAMAGAFGTYIAHLTGFVFLCCFIALHLAYSFSRLRRVAGPQLLAAALIPLPALAAYTSLGRGERHIGAVLWAFAVKARHAWVLFSGYAAWMDILVLASLMVVLLVVSRYGAVIIDPVYLIVVCAFLLAFMVLPTEFHTGTEADSRFLLPCALIATLAAEVRCRDARCGWWARFC